MIISTFLQIAQFVSRLNRSTSGVTAIEYGLIAGAIAVAIITAVTALGTDVATQFNSVANALTPAVN